MQAYIAILVLISICILCTTFITKQLLQYWDPHHPKRSFLEGILNKQISPETAKQQIRLNITINVIYTLLIVLFNLLDFVILLTYLKFSNRLKAEQVEQVKQTLTRTYSGKQDNH